MRARPARGRRSEPPSLETPAAAAKGTCGFAGMVENVANTKLVPFARIAVTPSRPWSGVSDGGAWAWPRDAVTTTADHWGAFVITNLPYARGGYDRSIRALGYGPARIVHEPCYEDDLAAGDFVLSASPSFEDATLYQ